MSRSSWKGWILVFVLSGLGLHLYAGQEAELSAAEKKVVAQQIAALKTSSDRHVAEDWSNAKKIAEIICRPAALSTLKKQDKSIDRVFLGTADPKTLTLESNQKLTGSGEYRRPSGWTDFTFTCEIDPTTAKATAFRAVTTAK